jgi:hypothetical protein
MAVVCWLQLPLRALCICGTLNRPRLAFSLRARAWVDFDACTSGISWAVVLRCGYRELWALHVVLLVRRAFSAFAARVWASLYVLR